MPTRTCIGCRIKREQREMLRVAADAHAGVALWKGVGRGAYICPDESCIEAALQRGKLERTLRVTVSEEARENVKKELLCKLR